MRLTLFLLLALVCSHAARAQGNPVADFRLRDENPNSPRYRTEVSPRDYRLQISAFYFGAAG